jgi:hypothetical protein
MGMSVATSPQSSSDPRAGTIYDPVTWAAAAPVWFHPISGATLMLSARRWHNATPLAGTPSAYSAFTEDTTPSWALVGALTGARNAVPGNMVNLPMNTVATGVALVGAVSRPPNLLFTLTAATVGGVSTAVLQRFHLGANGSVAIAAEDVLPTPTGITFTAGIQFAGDNLVVYGTDASHHVYKVTKPWGQVGANRLTTPTTRKYTDTDAVAKPLGWQYYTGTGYSTDVTEIAPVTLADGSTLTTHGPITFGSYRDQLFMSTVALSGTTYSGQFWRSRSGMPFAPWGSPVALGDSSSGTNLGSGIYLQPQLAPNPAAAPMLAEGVISGIPYLSWTKTAPSGGHILDVVWGILAIKS